MKKEEILQILKECCNDMQFEYHGKPCGTTPEVIAAKPIYHTWCGEENKDFFSAEQVMKADFFDGKSLNDICEEVDIWFS